MAPVHEAVIRGNFAEVQRLVRADCSRSEQKYTPCYYRPVRSCPESTLKFLDGATALSIACFLGKEQIAVWLLSQRRIGVYLHIKDKNRRDALSHACEQGRVRIVALLLMKGSNVDWQEGSMGWTPLMYACYHNHLQIIRLLLQRHPQVNLADAHGQTALHICCQHSYVIEAIQLLLEKGADPLIERNDGWTPLALTKSRNYHAAVRLMKGAVDDSQPVHLLGKIRLILDAKHIVSQAYEEAEKEYYEEVEQRSLKGTGGGSHERAEGRCYEKARESKIAITTTTTLPAYKEAEGSSKNEFTIDIGMLKKLKALSEAPFFWRGRVLHDEELPVVTFPRSEARGRGERVGGGKRGRRQREGTGKGEGGKGRGKEKQQQEHQQRQLRCLCCEQRRRREEEFDHHCRYKWKKGGKKGGIKDKQQQQQQQQQQIDGDVRLRAVIKHVVRGDLLPQELFLELMETMLPDDRKEGEEEE